MNASNDVQSGNKAVPGWMTILLAAVTILCSVGASISASSNQKGADAQELHSDTARIQLIEMGQRTDHDMVLQDHQWIKDIHDWLNPTKSRMP